MLNDIPVPGYYGEGSTEEGPSNYSLDYTGSMNVDRAIEQSQNAPAAWLAKELTPQAVFGLDDQPAALHHLGRGA